MHFSGLIGDCELYRLNTYTILDAEVYFLVFLLEDSSVLHRLQGG